MLKWPSLAHLALAACVVGLFLFSAGVATPQRSRYIARAASFPTTLQVSLGPEEDVAGPVSNYVDAPLVTMPTASGITAYSANATTYAFRGSSLGSVAYPAGSASSSQAVLGPGPAGSFDDCGAWLVSAYALTASHWIGWYHAEHSCNYSQGITHKSMAFVESFDGGQTWEKPYGVSDQIVTAPSQYATSTTLDHAGDGRVVMQGGYFYLLYLGGDYQTYAARSALIDQGRPGTWWKYYQGAWTQPGIGGQQSPLSGVNGTAFSYNTYLGAYLNIAVSARWGFSLNLSNGTDLTSWQPMNGTSSETIYPLATTASDTNQDNWGSRSSSSGLLYGYTALIDPSGDSMNTGQSFYLYYLKLFQGDTFASRYLFRRMVTLTSETTAPTIAATVDLDRYQNSSGKLRVMTDVARPAEGYQFQSRVGALLASPAPGFHAVYECAIPLYHDYVNFDGDPSAYNWQNCGDSGTPLIRAIGYVANSPIDGATRPIYRCFNPTIWTHFLSTSSTCEGQVLEWQVGYIFP